MHSPSLISFTSSFIGPHLIYTFRAKSEDIELVRFMWIDLVI